MITGLALLAVLSAMVLVFRRSAAYVAGVAAVLAAVGGIVLKCDDFYGPQPGLECAGPALLGAMLTLMALSAVAFVARQTEHAAAVVNCRREITGTLNLDPDWVRPAARASYRGRLFEVCIFSSEFATRCSIGLVTEGGGRAWKLRHYHFLPKSSHGWTICAEDERLERELVENGVFDLVQRSLEPGSPHWIQFDPPLREHPG